MNEYEAEQERLDRRTLELDAELRQHHNLIGQAALEIDRAENRILFNRQRVEQLRVREQQITGEREQASGQVAQLAARLAAQNDVVAGLRDETARLESLLSGIASRSSELAGSAQLADARMAELRAADRRTGRRSRAAAGRAGPGRTVRGAPCRSARAIGTVRTTASGGVAIPSGPVPERRHPLAIGERSSARAGGGGPDGAGAPCEFAARATDSRGALRVAARRWSPERARAARRSSRS